MKYICLSFFIALFTFGESYAQTNNMEFHQNLSKRTGDLHDLFDALLKEHVSAEGQVNYKEFQASHEKLLEYIYVLTRSHQVIDKTNRNEQLAYWINAYNALTIDLIIRNYPVESINDIKKPWDQKLWTFGETELSLNDIEHKILRKMEEPRIHFAIVCASISCPKLQNTAYTGIDLEQQLNTATHQFLYDSSKNSFSETSAEVSKIFKWFAKDFKASGGVIDFINANSDMQLSEKVQLKYKSYNWGLNE